ncbi:neprilysin-4-like isoform X1 [Maniola jurtina]|uniref:neprilysin-4-like isoform X1 n=1 Tax=Maniola jurtina TaxID=191418 RepID=UPI001E68A375|nr:neprilysin-4-like isoform X1 [Maniola jurtina]
MARVDTPPQTVSIKPKSANLCKFSSLILLTTFFTIAYFISKRPLDTLGDPSDQFTVKNVPSYTKLEGLDPEEREVFEGFRTSFIPPEEIILSRRDLSRKSLYEGNVSSDVLIWDKEQRPPGRVKRRSRYSFTSQDYDYTNQKPYKGTDEGNEPDLGEDEEEDVAETEYDSNSHEQDDDERNLHSIVHPEIYVDRGPLDDVEQVRRQPELEEGEMGSAAHVYKPIKSYTGKGIHAFWKGQGDRETIRQTQADIMKQYMDVGADPCHDFYQYACGNWPTLNPIPADKAGYDTFEMLRENLDTVLKDLLEFKKNEHVTTAYPGPHLDAKDSFLTMMHHSICPTKTHEEDFDVVIINTDEFDNLTEFNKNYDLNNTKEVKSEIINRIRRYLDKKAKTLMKPSKMKHKFHEYLSKNEHKKNHLNKHRKYLMNTHKNNNESSIKKRSINSSKNSKNKKSFFKRLKRIGPVGTMILKVQQTAETLEDDTTNDAALKARFLFKSCMNHDILKRRGHQPLLDLLDLLGGWPILKSGWTGKDFDWLELMAKLRLYNNDILISEWVGPDIKNSDEFVIQFDQTSLGLPTRDYFLQESNKAYLEAYKEYLIKIALLLGGEIEHVKASADNIINFEIQLAKITSAPEDRRNVSELYRRMSLTKLEGLVPQIHWRRYLCIVMNRTVHSQETVVLFALNYVRHLVQLIEETDHSTLSNYLLWRFVRHRVNNLDDRFQSAKQKFYYILFGREQAPPRWKNCISQINSNMGMALGSMFVRKYFDEMSKNDTMTMTTEIQQAFRELLHMTTWIDDETKKLAAHKVDSMMLRIGYPDFILNKHELDERYKEVKIHPDKYFENILNILQHLTKMEQSRIGQPVNKTLWNTAPAVVNAYYSRNKNQIMFPAGILQPPFYHRHFPRSLNFGGIGVVIGHEITHGFDDKGRLFDCEGNLHRWWSDIAIEAFHHRAQCLIDQYGQYIVPEVNMKLDGVNTQGENIADNGGVKQAFHAYQQWLLHHNAADETLPGLNHTNKQLFFLNFAQVWCGAMRPEAMRNKLKTAVHSPGRFRVIGTLSNSLDFAREFQCPPGSPMNPVNKCSVW